MKTKTKKDVIEILAYLHRNIKKGYKLNNLKWALIQEGYNRTSVFKAIEIIKKEGEKKIVDEKIIEISPTVEEIQKEKEKEGFFQKFFR